MVIFMLVVILIKNRHFKMFYQYQLSKDVLAIPTGKDVLPIPIGKDVLAIPTGKDVLAKHLYMY